MQTSRVRGVAFSLSERIGCNDLWHFLTIDWLKRMPGWEINVVCMHVNVCSKFLGSDANVPGWLSCLQHVRTERIVGIVVTGARGEIGRAHV